jgi:antitoxin component of MazEF toxin-antitoxin module
LHRSATKLEGGDDLPFVKKLIRVGDSTGVILDPEILHQVDAGPDSGVEISVEDSALFIRPSRYASDNDTRAAGRNVIRNRRRLLERLSK